MRTVFTRLVPFFVFLAALPVACAGPGSTSGGDGDRAGGADLRVLTYNIRYGTAADGPDAWEHRRGLALRVIAEERPHIIGVQEALRFQLDEVAAAFPRFGEVGVGRDDGREAGEYSAILFDVELFSLLETDTFWLSDTPRTVGSTSWGNSIPRIVTWARFRDRRTDRTFYVYNTHWDHASQPSRIRSAELLLDRIDQRTHPDDPVLLTGDFNVGERNPAFAALLAGGFTDTFRAVHPAATDVGTFHGFEGDRGGAKIDGVLATAGWRVRDAWIVTLNEDGRYPSDHFPVMAVVSDPKGS
jgi:endonuclease/exonuclease/phosphatase family metal-dependent hydrolase